MDVESAGEQFLEVVGRNEILIFRMLSNKTGDVRTERDNAEMIEAGENERNARGVGSQTLAFEWRRDLWVGIKDAAREGLIRGNGQKGAQCGFGDGTFFSVAICYVVVIY